MSKPKHVYVVDKDAGRWRCGRCGHFATDSPSICEPRDNLERRQIEGLLYEFREVVPS